MFSKRIRAGKRTYFFDVKSTRSNDYYITVTESRRYQKDDGFGYEKHKVFLYKEDFDKFAEGLNEAINHVKTELLPDVDFTQFARDDEEPYQQPQQQDQRDAGGRQHQRHHRSRLGLARADVEPAAARGKRSRARQGQGDRAADRR